MGKTAHKSKHAISRQIWLYNFARHVVQVNHYNQQLSRGRLSGATPPPPQHNRITSKVSLVARGKRVGRQRWAWLRVRHLSARMRRQDSGYGNCPAAPSPAFDMRKGMRRAGKVELAVGNITAIGLFTNRFEVCLLLLLASGAH